MTDTPTPITPPAPAAPAAPTILDEEKLNLAVAVLETTTSVLNPIEHEQLRKLSREYHLSGAYPESYKNPEQIMMAMIMGRSMGMTPHESVVNGYFIRGVYNVYGKAVPAALRRHGWQWKFINETEDACTAKLVNVTTGEEIEDTFTFQEAVDSGFIKDSYGKDKVGWKKGSNRKRKLRYGVLSQILHTYIPEVLGAAGGVAEYSEDYLEGKVAAEEDIAETRKQRLEAAAAERQAMIDADFKPEPVAPFSDDEQQSDPDADPNFAEVGYDQVKAATEAR